MGLIAARKGFEVKAIDLLTVKWYYSYPTLQFEKVDLFNMDLKENSLDLIISCSTIEHVGLKGSYKVEEGLTEGDIEAMNFLKKKLKPGKTMVLTLPVGRDKVYHNAHRVYGSKRLPKLLYGWNVIKNEFWIKDNQNRWIKVEKEKALDNNTKRHYYGLGLFVIQR